MFKLSHRISSQKLPFMRTSYVTDLYTSYRECWVSPIETDTCMCRASWQTRHLKTTSLLPPCLFRDDRPKEYTTIYTLYIDYKWLHTVSVQSESRSLISMGVFSTNLLYPFIWIYKTYILYSIDCFWKSSWNGGIRPEEYSLYIFCTYQF